MPSNKETLSLYCYFSYTTACVSRNILTFHRNNIFWIFIERLCHWPIFHRTTFKLTDFSSNSFLLNDFFYGLIFFFHCSNFDRTTFLWGRIFIKWFFIKCFFIERVFHRPTVLSNDFFIGRLFHQPLFDRISFSLVTSSLADFFFYWTTFY